MLKNTAHACSRLSRIAAAAASLLLISCAPEPPKEPFAKLAEEFVYTSLSYSPAAATQFGYHRHGNVDLDSILDDYSPQALQRQKQWYQNLRLRLIRSVRFEELSPEDRVDYQIVQDGISLALLELTTIQNYRHNPTLYVELIGNALYSPFVLEYADKNRRYQHIIGRLKAVPDLLAQGRRNLLSAPPIWTEVAIEENEGTIALIERTLRDGAPDHLRPAYDEAAKPAVAALSSFNDYLRHSLARTSYDWRLGRDNYAKKFRFVLGTDQTPDQVLKAAEDAMRTTREEMARIAGGDIRGMLDRIAQKHATPETYFADARRDLEEARQFVTAKDLLTLPARDNLQVIETPEFMRGIYSVGGFNPAPVLQPELGAFYWLTPIPTAWPKERIESKLREYNFYGLKLLTIHEAIPGHYVQLEYANDVQPPLRRVLRAVYGNGPYIEGWAVYATEMLLDEGYLNNSPELRLTFLKQQLRVFANTILDIRLQTMGMTDQEAMDLMIRDGFQEKEEAEGKLRRAKLSSVQLPTYFVGWRDWRRLREGYRTAKGAGYSLKTFNESALKPGAVPLPVLSRLLTGQPLPQKSYRP